MKRAFKSGQKNSAKATGSIRIIAGQWRGRKLPVLDMPGLRPTTDRTKETLFNWLAPYIAGAKCLDGFAGSGNLGFEALSRQAASVEFIEYSKPVAQQIKSNVQLLRLGQSQVAVHQGEFATTLPRLKTQYDLVFLDPPFAKGLLNPALQQLKALDSLSANALIYMEFEQGLALDVPVQWQLLKQKQTSQVDYRLYQRMS